MLPSDAPPKPIGPGGPKCFMESCMVALSEVRPHFGDALAHTDAPDAATTQAYRPPGLLCAALGSRTSRLRPARLGAAGGDGHRMLHAHSHRYAAPAGNASLSHRTGSIRSRHEYPPAQRAGFRPPARSRAASGHTRSIPAHHDALQ